MDKAGGRSAQAGRPHGWLGRAIGWIMAAYNRPENLWTVELVNPRRGEALLEVGCGPGLALEAAAGRQAWCVGLDHSPAMLAQARRRNRRAVERGSVRLVCGEAGRLPFAAGSFDHVLAINAVYFWPEPVACLRELDRVLQPGGLVALTVRRRHGGVYDRFAPERLTELLAAAGFLDPYVVDGPNPRHPVACALARAPLGVRPGGVGGELEWSGEPGPPMGFRPYS